MSHAGYLTSVKITGTGVAFSSESLSSFSTKNNTFRIDDTAKRVWDRSVTLTFTENATSTAASTIASTDISNVSYLFGYVTFNSTKTGTIRAAGTYLPLSNAAGANSYNLNVTRTLLDDTDFTSTGWTSRTNGLKDVNLTVSRWDNIDTDFFDLIGNGNDVVVEVIPGGSTESAFRGYFKVESENRSGGVSDLESADLSFQLNASTQGDIEFAKP